MPKLSAYRKKRRFAKTPEPRGKVRKRGGPPHFVVQKHDASRLHYDFRLEIDGVLKSWAVPKGPSLNPEDRRLAVRTEDHPLEYGGFEGVIPRGEYGGGTVLVWDRGTFEPLGGNPAAAVERGHLKFRLEGGKLRGLFALSRMGEGNRNWLLVKLRDAQARKRGDLTKSRPESVKSGHTPAQVARSRNRWHSRPKSRRPGHA